MLNPAILERALVNLILETPEAMELIGSPIAVYPAMEPDRGYQDFDEAVRGVAYGSVLVAHLQSGYGTYGGFQRWQHQFAIVIRAESMTASWEIASAILDGYPASGDGLRLIEMQLHESTDIPQGVATYKTRAEGDAELVRIDLTYSETGA